MKNFYQLSIFDVRLKYRTMLGFVLLLFAVLMSAIVGFGQTVTGNATRFLDGDTIDFRQTNGKYVRVRLSGIDAPESRQTAGLECKQLLKETIERLPLTLTILGVDVYKRKIGFLSSVEIPDVSLFMIQSGCAWEYGAPLAKKTQYQNAEIAARNSGLMLWADAHAQTPLSFRNGGVNPCGGN